MNDKPDITIRSFRYPAGVPHPRGPNPPGLPPTPCPATIDERPSLTVSLLSSFLAVHFRVEAVAWFDLFASGHLGSRPLTDNDMNKLLPRRYRF